MSWRGVSGGIASAKEGHDVVMAPNSHTYFDHYQNQAKLELEKGVGFECIGGENSPYIWVDGKSDSWEFFDRLLEKAAVVCTPGVGFGKCGAGYIRISAFNEYEKVQEALARIRAALA